MSPERARSLRRQGDLRFIVHVPTGDESAAQRDVAEAIREHFGFCRARAERKCRDLRSAGWTALLVAFVLLAVLMGVVHLIRRYFLTIPPFQVIAEGLVILAWVAFWRPADVLLYDWYPQEREARMFARLEGAVVRVVAGESPPRPPNGSLP